MLYEHVGRRDQVKLLDFGIAKIVQSGGGPSSAPTAAMRDVTTDDSLVGTIRYMSPEQLRNEPLGPPSDIYSLGLVGCELLGGRRAIESDSLHDIVAAKLVPDLEYLPQELQLPSMMRHIMQRMTHNLQSTRYQTTDEVLADIEQAIAVLGRAGGFESGEFLLPQGPTRSISPSFSVSTQNLRRDVLPHPSGAEVRSGIEVTGTAQLPPELDFGARLAHHRVVDATRTTSTRSRLPIAIASVLAISFVVVALAVALFTGEDPAPAPASAAPAAAVVAVAPGEQPVPEVSPEETTAAVRSSHREAYRLTTAAALTATAAADTLAEQQAAAASRKSRSDRIKRASRTTRKTPVAETTKLDTAAPKDEGASRAKAKEQRLVLPPLDQPF